MNMKLEIIPLDLIFIFWNLKLIWLKLNLPMSDKTILYENTVFQSGWQGPKCLVQEGLEVAMSTFNILSVSALRNVRSCFVLCEPIVIR